MNDPVIPGTTFTEAEDEHLVHLLDKVRRDKCRWPTEKSMRAAHAVCPYPATEIVISNLGNPRDPQVLLTQFEGGVEHWAKYKFWHCPGGYVNQLDGVNEKHPEGFFLGVQSLQPTVNRIAQREIKVSVKIKQILDAYFWPPPIKDLPWAEETGVHPYGRPISLWLHCELKGEFRPTETARFFPIADLPSPIVTTHRRFIQSLFVGPIV